MVFHSWFVLGQVVYDDPVENGIACPRGPCARGGSRILRHMPVKPVLNTATRARSNRRFRFIFLRPRHHKNRNSNITQLRNKRKYGIRPLLTSFCAVQPFYFIIVNFIFHLHFPFLKHQHHCLQVHFQNQYTLPVEPHQHLSQ